MKKIKVLHCVTAMNRGGLETLIMNYYRNIDRNKFDFDFLVQRNGDFDYSEEIKRMGGYIYSVPAFNPFRIHEYNSALMEFFSEHKGKYDIVHAHNNSFAMYVLRAAKRNGFPVRIAHSHIARMRFEPLKTPFVLYNKYRLKNYYNCQFACAKEAGRWLFSNDKSIIINNAIDLNSFLYDGKKRELLRKDLRISDDTILLGHIGRFNKQKNHMYLIKIFDLIIKKRINAKLLLIGDGELKFKIKDEVERRQLQDKVIFTGVVDNPSDYLCAMDVFLMPSLYEGLSVALIEAQANGLLCLVSDVVSKECKVSKLVKFLPISNNSINQWVEAVREKPSYDRRGYLNDLKEAGFDIRTATKRLEIIYDKLLQSCLNEETVGVK